MAGDGLAVAGGVELEVLRVVGLLLGVVLGHGGQLGGGTAEAGVALE